MGFSAGALAEARGARAYSRACKRRSGHTTCHYPVIVLLAKHVIAVNAMNSDASALSTALCYCVTHYVIAGVTSGLTSNLQSTAHPGFRNDRAEPFQRGLQRGRAAARRRSRRGRIVAQHAQLQRRHVQASQLARVPLGGLGRVCGRRPLQGVVGSFSGAPAAPSTCAEIRGQCA